MSNGKCSFTEMLLSVTWHRRPTKSKVPLTNRGSHLHSCRWQGQWLTDAAEYYSIKKETAPVSPILDLRGGSINMTIFLYDCQRLHHTRCHALICQQTDPTHRCTSMLCSHFHYPTHTLRRPKEPGQSRDVEAPLRFGKEHFEWLQHTSQLFSTLAQCSYQVEIECRVPE